MKRRSDKVINWLAYARELHWYVDSGPRLFSTLANTRVVVHVDETRREKICFMFMRTDGTRNLSSNLNISFHARIQKVLSEGVLFTHFSNFDNVFFSS